MPPDLDASRGAAGVRSSGGLCARGLSVRLGDPRSGYLAVDDVDLELAPGGRMVVLGPSGSGKTTLLRALAGLEPLSAGSLELDDEQVATPEFSRPARRRSVGFVFQSLGLWPEMTVEATLAFVATGSRGERRETARRLATAVGLGDRLASRPTALSGGERQRLAIARALAPAPRRLFLDEPFSQLDRPLRRELLLDLESLLASLGADPARILVTHDADDARLFGGELRLLESGRLVGAGPVHELFQDPRSAAAARLLDRGALLAATVRESGATLRLDTPCGALEARPSAAAGFEPAVGAELALLLPPATLLADSPGSDADSEAEQEAGRFRLTGRLLARFGDGSDQDDGTAEAIVQLDEPPASPEAGQPPTARLRCRVRGGLGAGAAVTVRSMSPALALPRPGSPNA